MLPADGVTETHARTHALETLERWDRFDWKSCQLIDSLLVFFLAGLIVGERSERRVRRQRRLPSANAQWRRRWRIRGLRSGQRAWNDFRSLRIARDILLALWNQNRRLDLIARTYTARIVTIVTIVRRGRSAEYGTRFRLGFMQKAQVAYLGRCFAIGISKFRNATRGPSRFLFF